MVCAALAQDALIFGVVVNSQTHEPVRRAIVKVYTEKTQWDVFTDGDGRFKFPSLGRGEYTMVAHRDSFSDRAYKLELSDFDNPKELSIELRPQAIITGRVIDGSGQPLQRAQIEALNARSSGVQVQSVGSTGTNDLGEYRLSGLEPGTYRLRATYREGRESEFDSTPLTMATTLYGGLEKPAELTVAAGSVTSGINFVLIAARPAKIQGTLHTETGVLTEPVTLWIAGSAGEGGHNGNAKDGSFAIGDVAPGTYTISANTLSKTSRFFGKTTVNVRDSDVDGVDILLRPSPKLQGQIQVVNGSLPELKIGSVFFRGQALGMPGGFEIAKPDEDGKFDVWLTPGDYTISIDSKLIDVRVMTLDGRPFTDWKINVDAEAGLKKLVIVVKPKAQQ